MRGYGGRHHGHDAHAGGGFGHGDAVGVEIGVDAAHCHAHANYKECGKDVINNGKRTYDGGSFDVSKKRYYDFGTSENVQLGGGGGRV